MKKVLILLALVVILGMTNIYAQTEIWTADNLNNIRYDLGASYIQMADIDLSGYASGEGWVPIGSYLDPFSGILNGNGFTITNLVINRPGGFNQGIFGFTTGATFTNVSVINANVIGYVRVATLLGGECNYTTTTDCYASGVVTGDEDVGMLAAMHYYSTMSGCHSDGMVYGNQYVGGLVGTNTEESSISDSYSSATAEATGDGVGGLAGTSTSSSVIDCYATGDVNGNNYVGGLIGLYANYSVIDRNIERSYATGSITGNNEVAGLVGWMTTNCAINDCYATGSVTGNIDVGGLLGWSSAQSWGPSSVTNCYSTGFITGMEWVGGLIGDQGSDTPVSNCYWNVETSGQANSSGGEVRTTDDMTYPYSDSTYVSWDFVDIWNNDVQYTINNGYPFLSWQEVPPDAPTNISIFITGNDIELYWDDMDAITYYIYRSTDPYAVDWGVAIGSSGVNSYTDYGAAVSGNKYFYYVTASD